RRRLGRDRPERGRPRAHGRRARARQSESREEEARMIDSLLRIAALVRKELLGLLKEPRSRNSLIVPSILQCLIYGYVATYDLTDVPCAVVDQDRSASSRELLARLDGSGVFHRAAEPESLEAAKRLLDERRVLLVVQFAQDFERQVHSGRPAVVQIAADGRNS